LTVDDPRAAPDVVDPAALVDGGVLATVEVLAEAASTMDRGRALAEDPAARLRIPPRGCPRPSWPTSRRTAAAGGRRAGGSRPGVSP